LLGPRLLTLTIILISFSLLATSNAETEQGSINIQVLNMVDGGSTEGQVFYLIYRGSVVSKLFVQDGVLRVPALIGARIVGPIPQGGVEYMPLDLYIDFDWQSSRQLTIVLERAWRVRITDLYPWIDGKPLKASYKVELLGGAGNYSKIMTWQHGSSDLKLLLGLGDGEVLIPAYSSFSLVAQLQGTGAGDPPLVMEINLTDYVSERLSKGERTLSLLPFLFDAAYTKVRGSLESVEEVIRDLEAEGIYLGYQWRRVERTRSYVENAVEKAAHGLWSEAYFELRRAYIEVENIGGIAKGYTSTVGRDGILFPLLMILGSLVISYLLVHEQGRTRIVAGVLLLSAASLVLVSLRFPFLTPGDAWGWAALLYAALFMMGVILGVEALGIEVKTYRGVALLSAARLAFSLSLRFLKSRPLRTWLMVCMASITVAATLLLVNVGAEGQVFASRAIDRVEAPGASYLVLYSTGYRYDNPSEISPDYIHYLRSMGLEVGLRAETPILPPSGTPYNVNGSSYNLRGILGVLGKPPFIGQIKGCLVEGDVEEVAKGRGAAIVSQDLAERLQARKGTAIVINDVELRVSGVISGECPIFLKDIDGYFASTLVQPPMSPVGPAGWSSMIVTGVDEAVRLGASPTKIYAKLPADTDPQELAERVTYQTGLKARLVSGSGEVYAFSLSRVAGIRGGEVVAVAVIALLNILVTSLANYYERRKEIFTMSTLGLNPAHIVLISLAEAAILAIVSTFIGIVMALGVFAVTPILAEASIDFKVSQWTAMPMLGYTLCIFSIAHVVSVRRSIILSTPAQEWRWTLSKTLDADGYWSVELPARIRWDRVDRFLTYLVSRLSEYSYTTTIKIDVWGVEEVSRGGDVVKLLRFTYSSTEQRPFTSDTILEVRRQEDKCKVTLKCKIAAAHEQFVDTYIREVAQQIRQLIIEFASLTVRVLVPLASKQDHIYPLLNVYAPNEVRIVWRGQKAEEVSKVIREVESRMVRVIPVMIDENSAFAEMARVLVDAAEGCDLLCISSDDGVLSTLIFLTAQKLNKRVCVVSGQEVLEATPDSIWEQFR
jgi:hypothetical protein